MSVVIWCLMATKLACNGNVGGSVEKGHAPPGTRFGNSTVKGYRYNAHVFLTHYCRTMRVLMESCANYIKVIHNKRVITSALPELL